MTSSAKKARVLFELQIPFQKKTPPYVGIIICRYLILLLLAATMQNLSNMTDENEREPSSYVPPTPSLHSPVGGQYAVTLEDDDDDDDQAERNSRSRRGFDNLSPVPHRSSPSQDPAFGGEDPYYTYEPDEDFPPSRFRLNSDMSRLSRRMSSGPARLNGLNYLNVVTYLVNLFVSYGIGVWGLDGLLPTRLDISKEFATLITPASWAYWLWAPILVSEGIFAVCQLLPHFRARPIIQSGTGYFFFYTCIISTAWTLFFAFKLFIFSFVAVVAALLSLASLLASQHYSQVRGRKSRMEYWLFRFPFYLHCGWLILCSVVQFSLLFKHLTSNVGVQLAADIVALGAMLPAATFFLTGQPSGPDFVIPLVIVWSYIGVGLELNHPNPDLEEQYEHFSIVAIRDAAFFFAGTVGLMLVPRVIIWFIQEFCTINVIELDDLSEQPMLTESLLDAA